MKKPFLLLLFFAFTTVFSQTQIRSLSEEKWEFSQSDANNWLPAEIPSVVHLDLYKNGQIPDPFYSDNEKQLQWIEEKDWIYSTTFSVSREELENQNIELIFEGLDTYAEVFLNGKPILKSENMFIAHQVDVKKILNQGQNTLVVRFESAVRKGKEKAANLPYKLPEGERVFTRKAQYQFGWDWGPRFVTCGIWKDVKLRFWNHARIENIKYEQISLHKDLAELEFTIDFYVEKTGEYVVLFYNDEVGVYDELTVRLTKGKNSIVNPYEIKNPKLWWTNGLGEQNRYEFNIALFQPKKTEKLDTKTITIGLRTIELVQEKDELGTSFYFKLNGVPVFMKGTNYIPSDSFLPRVNDSIYKQTIQAAVDANMNMLRVWGGGIYENDTFYEECDKNGILVWQDFMFACAMYPGDEDFLKSVKEEVIQNVNRLQNHPSIALWCGNNEVDEAWHNWGWQKQFGYSEQDSTQIWNDYQKVFKELIPKTLDSLLSKEKNIYWESSPSIGWGRKESLVQGDSHYWGVWWGKQPFEIYREKVGRFMSEYGFQGMPDLSTFRKIAPENELHLNSVSVKNHQKHPTGYQTIQEYMERDFPIPADFEDYIYVSQLLQAHGLQIAIEAHRQAMPYCMGTLFWQFNDCWPVTSWSAIDYYGVRKAAYYQAKRSFEPVLLSITEDENDILVYGTNDLPEAERGMLRLELLDFESNIAIWQETHNMSNEPFNKQLLVFQIKENSSNILTRIPKKMFDTFNKNKTLLKVSLFGKEKVHTTVFYFTKPKDLALTKPTIELFFLDNQTIILQSDVLAKNVFLKANDVVFDDNYFDLLPRAWKVVKLSKPVEKIEIKSLFDVR
ncbi:MAG: sugar-binding domain-containing protein [Flavobacteriaceae bacterium]